MDLPNHTKREHSSQQAGVSLLELIIYIGTSMIAIIGIVALFTILANSWVRVQARAQVEEGARLAVERMRFEVESAEAIISPTPGGFADTLSVSAGASRTYAGYAFSPHAGWISFACDSDGDSEAWNDCGQAAPVGNYGVTSIFNRLSGFAHTRNAGDILFDCADSGSATACDAANYQVSVDASGDWHGWAYSDSIGWISMNCENTGSCFVSGTSTNLCGGDDGQWRVCERWDTSGMTPVLLVVGWAWSEHVGWISFSSENPVPIGGASYGVTAGVGTEIEFGVDGTTNQLYVEEAGGARQYLTDDNIFIAPCDGWTANYFRVVANPAPARAGVNLCFTATYIGPGGALTNYSTEVETTFEL